MCSSANEIKGRLTGRIKGASGFRLRGGGWGVGIWGNQQAKQAASFITLKTLGFKTIDITT